MSSSYINSIIYQLKLLRNQLIFKHILCHFPSAPYHFPLCSGGRYFPLRSALVTDSELVMKPVLLLLNRPRTSSTIYNFILLVCVCMKVG